MPFPPSQKRSIQHRDLADIASEVEGELKNIYFVKNPDTNLRYPKETLGFAQQGTNASLPGAKSGLGIGGYHPSVGSSAGIYAAWDDATPDTQIYKLGAADPTSQGASARLTTNGNTVEFEQVNDDLYATNGIDTVLKLTGSAGTWGNAGASEPYAGSNTVAKYLTWHNFMLFASRTVTAPNKLNVSDAGDPTTFSGNTKTFPYAVIGQKSLGEQLVIYTEKTIHVVTGYVPSQLNFREIKTSHPCVSHRSIVVVPNDNGTLEHFFLGTNYVWAFNGTGLRKLGEDSWDNILATLNTAKLNLAAAYYDNKTKQYRISVCTGANTANDTTYAYDLTSDKWVKLPNRSAAAYTSYGVPTPDTYWIESGASGLAFKENSGNNLVYPYTQIDNGSDITATDATIDCDSTTGYDSSGYITIDSETIRYTGTTATSFTGCIRGANGTTAAAHTDNTPIYQSQEYCYTTRFLDDNRQNLFKKYKKAWLDVKSSSTAYNLDASIDVDQLGSSVVKNISLLETGALWGTAVYPFTFGSAAVVQYSTNRYPISGRGREIKFKFQDYSNIQQTELYQFEYQYRVLNKK